MKKILYCFLVVSGILSVSCEDNATEDFVQFNSAVVQPADDFTDTRDNNTYHCIRIGDQIWMAENLRYQLPNYSLDGCYTWGEAKTNMDKVEVNITDDKFKEIGQKIADDPQYEGWPQYANFGMSGGAFIMIMYISDVGPRNPQSDILGILSGNFREFYTPFAAAIEDIKQELKKTPEVILKAGLDNFRAAEKENGGYISKYGVLYSYVAALAAIPQGWRLPTDEDWMKLETTLGMSREEVEKIEAWRGNGMAALLNEGGESKFNALKAGGNIYTHENTDHYINKDVNWYFWSSSKYQENDSTSVAMIRMSAPYTSKVWRGTSRITNGYHDMLYSVRCIKNVN